MALKRLFPCYRKHALMMDAKPKVIVVDDSRTSRTYCTAILSDKHEVRTAASGKEFFALLDTFTPEIVLLDVEMPDLSGYDVIRRFKQDPAHADIPVMFLTAHDNMEKELEGLSLGAVDYLAKHSSPPVILRRIGIQLLMASQKRQLRNYNENLQRMVEEKTRTVTELQNGVFDLLTQVVEFRDDQTGGHVDRTKSYFGILLEAIGAEDAFAESIRNWDKRLVVLSSQLHDIGKVAIRDDVLLKPGRLSEVEFNEMKKHTVYGSEIIARIERSTSDRSFINYAGRMARFHHERWDGTGYPDGLKGHDIPLEGRLMAVVDVYDALISPRPYKAPFSPEKALAIIIESAGTHFDPDLVRVFAEIFPCIRAASTVGHGGLHAPGQDDGPRLPEGKPGLQHDVC